MRDLCRGQTARRRIINLKVDNDNGAGASFRQFLAVGGSACWRHTMSQKECTVLYCNHKWVRRWHGRWPRSESSALMIHLRSYPSELTAQRRSVCFAVGEIESPPRANRVSTEDFWLLKLFSSPQEAQNSQAFLRQPISCRSSRPCHVDPASRRIHAKRLLRFSRCPGSRRSDEWSLSYHRFHFLDGSARFDPFGPIPLLVY